jgi:hypothetical protein
MSELAGMEFAVLASKDGIVCAPAEQWQALRARITQLEAELAEANADAERWRFAVEMAQPENWAEVTLFWPSNKDGGFVGQTSCCVAFGREARVQAWEYSFGAAIDKARSEEKSRNEFKDEEQP